MRYARASSVILAAVILLGCSACEPGDTPKREAQELQGIVLILLDTVRADHVGCYGYDRPTTPNMDALAKRGVRFDQVIAPSPWTLPSVAALLSAQHPTREFASTRKITTSVVEDLQRAGFET
ncbi:MAG: sulfatase-like hydrolase/transferase, partial [Planctomycetes bacterium]|nr:sulfatase-like hydrolase/transferase [Planctomycetota bacterium]